MALNAETGKLAGASLSHADVALLFWAPRFRVELCASIPGGFHCSSCGTAHINQVRCIGYAIKCIEQWQGAVRN
jgi:hypothetical protein